MKSVKTQVVFPETVIEELKESVPARQRSAFISSATRKELARLRLQHIVNRPEPIWSEADHPGLKSPASIRRTLKKNRRGWQKGLNLLAR